MSSFKKLRGGPGYSRERDHNFERTTQFALTDPNELQRIRALSAEAWALLSPHIETADADDKGNACARVAVASIEGAVVAFVMMGLTAEGAADAVRLTVRARLEEINARIARKERHS